jgi:hypothetical protein
VQASNGPKSPLRSTRFRHSKTTEREKRDADTQASPQHSPIVMPKKISEVLVVIQSDCTGNIQKLTNSQIMEEEDSIDDQAREKIQS